MLLDDQVKLNDPGASFYIIRTLAQDGWTADQAFDEMKKYKFGPAFLHREFRNFVYAFKATRSAVEAVGGGK